jgi:YfiH family protein
VQAAPGPALACRPLEATARHLFSTRQWLLGSAPNGDSPTAWRDVARAIDVDLTQLARLHQVHGTHAVVAEPALRPDADIVVSDSGDIALAIQTADCVPLLIGDTRTGAVAAAHAGWRGLLSRVPIAAVEMLSRQFASRPADLVVAVGPSIGACCYEVGDDVRARFEAAGFGSKELERWFFLEPQPTARNPSMPGLPATRRADRWYFDGWAATRDLLVSVGVPVDRIHIAELCTASHPTHLCSYRRDGKGAGRMAAVIRSATRS